MSSIIVRKIRARYEDLRSKQRRTCGPQLDRLLREDSAAVTIQERMILPFGRLPLRTLSFFLTDWLVSSRRASAAIHFADLESEYRIFAQVLIAAAFKLKFLFPICLSAQFTAFLTKLRSSEASLTISGRKSRNVLFEASLS